MITTFALNTLDGIGLKVPQSDNTSSYYCSCSDRHLYNPKITVMHEKQTTNHWPDNDFERRYWQKIHNLNRKESPRATPDKTPVGQYVLHLVEMINTEEA
jgi:hypothetical protein